MIGRLSSLVLDHLVWQAAKSAAFTVRTHITGKSQGLTDKKDIIKLLTGTEVNPSASIPISLYWAQLYGLSSIP